MRKYDRQEDLLWKAAYDGNTARVKAMLRMLEPSKNRELIRDVLLCAVQNGHAPVVKALLAAGGNVEQVVSVRMHGKGNVGAKSKSEVVAGIRENGERCSIRSGGI